MRVLHVLAELRPSGAEVCLKVAAPYWTRAGLEGEILSVGPQLGPYAETLAAAGYRLHHLPQDPAAAFVPAYLALLRERRPDVVHLHVERANFYLALLARAAGVGVVIANVHSVFAFSGTLRLERRVQRAVMRAVGVRFVSVSAAVQRAERERFANPSVVLPNWYDDARCFPPSADQRARARARLGCPDGAFVVASVGNCAPVKNHAAAVEAVALLGRSLGEREVRYLHAGAEAEGRPERALAERLGVAGAVDFLGAVGDVTEVLQAADAYVMPSLREGASVAAFEALACGVPAVLADVAGLRSQVRADLPVTWTATSAASVAEGLATVAGWDPAHWRQVSAELAASVAEHAASRAWRGYADLWTAPREARAPAAVAPEPGTVRVAAVLACHNRVDSTLAALRALYAQEGVDHVDLAVHLLDDASTDGTADRVADEFPKVTVSHGDGNRYWNGGMRVAFAAALAEDPDHSLWLNDDTLLDPGALATLLATAAEVAGRSDRPAIVAGSTRDPHSGVLTYGGNDRPSRVRPLRFALVEPLGVPRPVETMNGNAVLIPRAVARRVGNLEPAYRHGIGDLDYGLRARAAGCEVWIAPGSVGTCARNPVSPLGTRPRAEEWRRFRSVKELPARDWQVFARRWAGPLWPLYWLSPYVRRAAALLRAR